MVKISRNVTLCVLLVVTIIVGVTAYKMTQKDDEQEDFSTGFSVTSGLSFYNKAHRCADGNSLGSSSPYCESVGQVLF